MNSDEEYRAMTVAELIEELKHLNQSAEVWTLYDHGVDFPLTKNLIIKNNRRGRILLCSDLDRNGEGLQRKFS